MPRISRDVTGCCIRQFRDKANLTPAELAQHLGRNPKSINRYEERGAPRWMLWALVGLSLKLGLDPAAVRTCGLAGR